MLRLEKRTLKEINSKNSKNKIKKSKRFFASLQSKICKTKSTTSHC
jgi:hypothetical protein